MDQVIGCVELEPLFCAAKEISKDVVNNTLNEQCDATDLPKEKSKDAPPPRYDPPWAQD